MSNFDTYRDMMLALERIVSIRAPFDRECAEAETRFKAAQQAAAKSAQRQHAELSKRQRTELNNAERGFDATVENVRRKISELPTKIKERIGVWKIIDLLEDSFGIEIERLKTSNPKFAAAMLELQSQRQSAVEQYNSRKNAVQDQYSKDLKKSQVQAAAHEQQRQTDHNEELATLQSRYRQDMDQAVSRLTNLAQACRAFLGSADGSGAAGVTHETGFIYIGDRVGDYAGIPIDIPMAYRFPFSRHFLLVTKDAPAGDALFHVLLLQLLSAVSPGRVALSVADPERLGKAISPFLSLRDWDEPLIEKQIATDQGEIEKLLIRTGDHIEDVIQNHLRERYDNLEAYNRNSGNLFIPYRVVVMCACANHLSRTAEHHLANIIRHGVKCGVFILMVETSAPAFEQEKQNVFTALALTGRDAIKFIPPMIPRELHGCLRFRAATLPAQSDLTEFLRVIADAANQATVKIEYGELLRVAGLASAKIGLTGNARERLEIPLGLDGPHDALALSLGKETLQHVLIMGKSGSGKSNLLHVLICTAARIYGPDELCLFLVDFKKGVEFQCYARERLPQAVLVGIESDRDLGISVLRRVNTELERRGTLFRNAGAVDYPDFRLKQPAPLPRIMLIFDEFQLLFDPDDEIAAESKRILDHLVKQGRGFGIHVILATQTISGVWNMARGTISQMAIRIALQCDEGDARLILSDANPAAKKLKRSGEAILNTTNGQPEGNTWFQVALLSPEVRARVLPWIRKAADKAAGGHAPVPTVYDGTGFPDARENAPFCRWYGDGNQFGRSGRSLTIPLGESSDLSGLVAVTLNPEPGANILAAARDGEAADHLYAIIGLSLVRLAEDTSRPVRIITYDPAGCLTKGLPQGLTLATWTILSRQSQVCEMLESLRLEIATEAEESGAKLLTLVVLVGVQKLLDLNPTAARPSGNPSPGANFVHLLRNGAESGVHFVCFTNDISNFVRNIDPNSRLIGDFNHRIGLQMSEEKSSTMFGARVGSGLGDRKGAYQDRSENRITKFRPFDSLSLVGFQEIPSPGGVSPGATA